MNPAAAGAADHVTAFAAASLANVLEEIAGYFEEKGMGRVTLSFAASSTLAWQIDNGAPCDLFISANETWMDWLAGRGRIEPGSRSDVARNRLALIAPSPPHGNGDLIIDLASGAVSAAAMIHALGDGRLAMGDPDYVPAGIYGKAALSALGLWQDLSGRIAPMSDVRAALAFVERGEVPMGIVYATDVKISRGTRVVAIFPQSSHPPVIYSAALVKGRASAAARRFKDFLASSPARSVFIRSGFVID